MEAQLEGKKKILLVDDSSDIRTVLPMLLKANGFDVDTAENGHEGLEKLQSSDSVSVVLLDLYMPDMDGREFLSEKHKLDEAKDVPVFILSAMENAGEFGGEVIGFIPKPINFKGLVDRLKHFH